VLAEICRQGPVLKAVGAAAVGSWPMVTFPRLDQVARSDRTDLNSGGSVSSSSGASGFSGAGRLTNIGIHCAATFFRSSFSIVRYGRAEQLPRWREPVSRPRAIDRFKPGRSMDDSRKAGHPPPVRLQSPGSVLVARVAAKKK